MTAIEESISELLADLQLKDDEVSSLAIATLQKAGSNYIKDLRINLKNVLASEVLSPKETALLAVSIAANGKNDVLLTAFTHLAERHEASVEEIGEAVACASLLASNNVLYRFRHFIEKEKYTQLPGRIRMNIMMNPVLGKEFFELMSLAVSAVNGCELCVTSHEHSLIELGTKEERIFDAIRLASVVTSADRIIR
ncbi:MAG: alkylhydroperoxidase [Cytophagaceae bacterium]|nr:alkylhydroperoxidase [Cytophagaceae bacterium]